MNPKLVFLVFLSPLLLHLSICPYTKVEESFHMQCSHDLFYLLFSPPSQTAYTNVMDVIPKLKCLVLDYHYYVYNKDEIDTQSEICTNVYTTINNFDHKHFPGVVPRSLLPTLILLTLPLTLMSTILPKTVLTNKPIVSMLHRVLLGTHQAFISTKIHGRIKVTSTSSFGNADGNLTANLYMLVTVVLPHFNFYASRLLPNSYALLFSSLSLFYYLDPNSARNQVPNGGDDSNSGYKAISTLIIACLTCRCDLVMLMLPLSLCLLYNKRVTLIKGVMYGLITTIITLVIVVPVDTITWSLPSKPNSTLTLAELQVLLYNIPSYNLNSGSEGSYKLYSMSEEWGVMPNHWYITNALPKCYVGVIMFLPFVYLYTDTDADKRMSSMTRSGTVTTQLLIPVATFIGLYSMLKHKEIRFILPILPFINVLLSIGLTNIYTAYILNYKNKTRDRKENIKKYITITYIAACLASTLCYTCIFLSASSMNYPGGYAVELLHDLVPACVPSPESKTTNNCKPTNVYVDVESSQTGITLYQTLHTGWRYTKGGYEGHNSKYSSSGSDFDSVDSDDSDNNFSKNLINDGYTHIITSSYKDKDNLEKYYKVIGSVLKYNGIDIRNFRFNLVDGGVVWEVEGFTDLDDEVIMENCEGEGEGDCDEVKVNEIDVKECVR